MGNEQIVEEGGSADSYRFCSCYNISKNLLNYVREKIEAEGVVEDFIYPDPKKIAWNSFQRLD
jgi:hypothetical protein